ncbi:MAG TPA: alpha/beta fold hydrolase [Micromonosporaceae bacterium]|nr:alpha/beta fold hydrolase [Micromonosporaceae bacterium]
MTTSPEYSQEYLDRGTHRIGLQVYPEPEGAADAPVVVIWPAMGVPASYYRRFAAALRDVGLAVIVADLRGTGASTPRPSRLVSSGYSDLVADVGAVQESLKSRLDGRRRVLLGHSLGGQVTLLHLALAEEPMADGLALVAVGMPYWRAYPGLRSYGVLSMTQGIAAATSLLGVWPGWGFGGRQSRGVIRDWAFTARTGNFPIIDGADPEAAIRGVRTPILAVSMDDDAYTPPATLDHLCHKLSAAPVQREHYTVAQAGGPLGHFSWVRAAAPLAARVAAFTADLPLQR